tara:strand:+ start:405 stop:1184 length:780 start_codon:yes stop_codon:yes gene_type:complete
MRALINAIDQVLIKTVGFVAACESYAAILDTEPFFETSPGNPRAAVFLTTNITVKLIESDSDPGLAGLIFQCADRDAIKRRLQRVGLDNTDMPIDRSAAAHAFILLSPEKTRGLTIGITQGATAIPPDPGTPISSQLALDHIVIATDQPEHIGFLLSAQLGLDLRMDLSNEQWNSRLLFFRCGDAIVEVYSAINKNDRKESDHFFGLTWRVTDIAATHKRLQKCGFEASEIRKGRKPGTAVFTLKTGTEHVPTLFLGPT